MTSEQPNTNQHLVNFFRHLQKGLVITIPLENDRDLFYTHRQRFNELVRTARAETDDAKRQALYAEAQQIIHDDGGLILLLFSDNVSAHSKKLAHGELNSNFPNDGALLFERWWFV